MIQQIFKFENVFYKMYVMMFYKCKMMVVYVNIDSFFICVFRCYGIDRIGLFED